jgi:hypothetical protein
MAGNSTKTNSQGGIEWNSRLFCNLPMHFPIVEFADNFGFYEFFPESSQRNAA